MQIRMFMMGIGKMIKHMEQVYILIVMAPDMKVNGVMISNMVKELNHGLTAQDMKETM